MQKIQILWADDEIDLLKPHILFLKAKNYDITTVNNGYDAVEEIRNNSNYDIVFLDENMPSMSGLDALDQIKDLKPNLPVVMITKSEEESIMENAIGSKIADYLIKPVNPNQILLAIKRILDNKRLISEKTTADYQQDFRNIGMAFNDKLSANEWAELYAKIVNWEIKLQQSDDSSMKEVFDAQKAEANTEFSKFIAKNYMGWFHEHQDESPVMSHNLLQKKLLPILKKEDKTPVFFLLIDNLRLDQFRVIEPIVSELFRLVQDETYYAILPTSTEFARNSLFAGMLPTHINQRYPQKLFNDQEEEHSRNQHEEFFLNEQLKRYNLASIKTSYNKITNLDAGKDLIDKIHKLFDNQLNVIVYNFVDMLSHARTEMKVIKELAEDEAAYRSLTKSWFEHSPLFEIIKRIAEKPSTIVITTDHGSVRVQNPVRIIGDRQTSTNLRYKEGRNLNYQDRDVFTVKNPAKVFLPENHVSSTYAFATTNQFFVYPNNYNHYVGMYKDTFQHGGISLEEIIVPYAVFEKK